ncbi:MAG: saccharopine dehydrogenase NADP-binding domain-containing protein [Deltaproteobacteria bacterium]|nr:saccharopine dehydrogenase NADP-binding domain-containing protein [Deltaproteobacteria bacterium]
MIVVFGAGGVVGRAVCAELARAGVAYAAVARHPVAGEATTRLADAFDAAALARALSGARAVINCAGPLRETAAPVLVASMAAGAHYLDAGGEQAVLHALYERHESTVRRAGLIAMPGAGVDCVVGDLASAWAAEHLTSSPERGAAAVRREPAARTGEDRPLDGATPAAVRSEPAARIGEDRPLDDVAVSYVLDDLALSPGGQRALFGTVGASALAWRRDRWERAGGGERRRVNAGADSGGERDAIGHAGGDAITVPRHVAAARVTTYASTTRSAAGAGALRLLARALPLLPRAAGDLLVPYADPDADYGRTRFAVVAQVRRGFDAAQVVVRGRDLCTTTARIAAWAAQRLVERGAGPLGMRAPGELFRAAPALRELAAVAGLTLAPGF